MFLSDGPHSEASEKLDHAAKGTEIQIKQAGYFLKSSGFMGPEFFYKNAIIIQIDPTSCQRTLYVSRRIDTNSF